MRNNYSRRKEREVNVQHRANVIKIRRLIMNSLKEKEITTLNGRNLSSLKNIDLAYAYLCVVDDAVEEKLIKGLKLKKKISPSVPMVEISHYEKF